MNTTNLGQTKGIIFNIQRYCIHDGPGIRTIVFLKGCPLRCLWCSNPESQIERPELIYLKSHCFACGKCVKVCPRGALTLGENGININRTMCNACGRCAEQCPGEALRIIGKMVTVDEVMAEIKKDWAYYRRSQGGVTLSGGEPTLQYKFASALLQSCKDIGINTAIETSGYQKWVYLQYILPYVDNIFYDIKVMNAEKHLSYTGVNNRLILENVKRISELNIPLIIRIPIIPDINTYAENLKLFGEFVSKLKSVERVELIPYHQYGVYKYEGLGRPYALANIKPPEPQYLEDIKSLITEYGIEVQIGG